MHIYFDLYCTLVDESGRKLRPCMKKLLSSFKDNGIDISLWTGTTEKQTYEILNSLEIRDYFTNIICRDDYDPLLEGYPKDIGKFDGDFLVDDDKDQIEFVRSTGKDGYLISPYVIGDLEYLSELEELHRIILPEVELVKSKDGLRGCGCLVE